MNTHLTSRLVRTPRKIGSRSVRTIRSTPLLLMLVVVLISAAIAPPPSSAQSYRYWQDTTLPEQRTPKRVDPSDIPIGLFIYNTTEIPDVWDFAESVGCDLLYYSVNKWGNSWTLYQALLDSAPVWGQVSPIIFYAGHNGITSVLQEASDARAVTFYPFDSSQMRDFVDLLQAKNNVFTYYSYDTLRQNPSYQFPQRDDWFYSEAVYDTGMANEVVASGICFDYKLGRDVRYERRYDPGSQSWSNVGDSAMNSRDIFWGPYEYAYRDAGGDWKGNGYLRHREGHHIVLRGHLFEGGAAGDSDPLIRINVWYEISEGQTYYDSSGTLVTADTNLRYLYKTIDFTKTPFKPTDPITPDWDEYHEAVAPISFRREGMGGPTDTLVTAQDIDLEVIYLGGEKVALHSIEIRDSVYHLLIGQGSESDDYRQKIRNEIDALIRDSAGAMRTTIFNLFLSDEPTPETTPGYRYVKNSIIKPNYIYPGDDSLASGNGSASPHLEHLGDGEWSAFLNYYEGNPDYGTRATDFGVTLGEIPSIRAHNGGRFGIPELMVLDSVVDSTYRTTLAQRLDDYNEVLNIAIFGANNSEQEGNTIGYQWSPFTSAKIDHNERVITTARRLGRWYNAILGPTSSFRIDYDDQTQTRDTLAVHRPEATEVRLLATLSLAYGAKMITWYTLEAPHWMSEAADGGPVGDIASMGVADFDSFLTPVNSLDWTLRTPGTSDSLGVVPDFYLGAASIQAEMAAVNDWLKNLLPTISRLRWRDAYSMHWQQRRPGNPKDSNRTPRPLPSDELLTSVTARHPVTGVVDSAWRTYVEVGMFETHTDTIVGLHDPMKDTNWLILCNRRGFSTGNFDQGELGYSNAVRDVLDTLTETRTMVLDFNLCNPDTTQYTFIRVREVAPDTTELPLIGVRKPLDTIIHGDSAVELTLGPGRATLLEITYEPGDTSIVDGELWWSNQRKMVYYEDDRFHMTYLRNDTVFYRRSNKMGDPAGSIVWEALERVVSSDPFSTRVQNWAPSMTMRTQDGNVIASIVWTSHSDSTGVRDVVLRDLITSSQTSSLIHFVDYHTGTDSTQWGDAVICAAHGGDIIAWGDSTLGILARVRKLGAFGAPPALSTRDLVSLPWHTTKVGRWPTVPTFTHIRGVDSSSGIAWNQPTGVGAYSEIRYARILQLPDIGTTPHDTILNGQVMSAAPKLLGRPTIDQTQDVWYRVQEGLAWIELNGSWGGHELLWFRSLYTPTNDAHPGYTNWDSIEFTQAWGFATTQGPRATTPDCYPNTSALNEVYYPIDDSLKDAHFSIALVDNENPSLKIEQATVQYGTPSFIYAYPQIYAYGGNMPHGSSSPITQDYRHAILYEADVAGIGPVLRTTRQYFGARAKPSGYIAGGRSVHFSINDSAATGIEILMHDPWMADNTTGTPLDMIERDFTEQTDTLSQVEELLRTAYFAAGDSTRIGVELAGRFHGDSSIGGAARVSLIAELVDSASGTVVVQLDSIAVSAASDSQHVYHAEDYDLLSGTYFIRVRLDTVALMLENRPHSPRYPVAEYASRVDESPAARAAIRLGATTGTAARISAQPNPFSDRTEIRFSIHRDETVTIVIVDASGREVARPVRGERYEAGRYAVEFETGNLVEGTYVMELRAGSARAVEKLIVRR